MPIHYIINVYKKNPGVGELMSQLLRGFSEGFVLEVSFWESPLLTHAAVTILGLCA